MRLVTARQETVQQETAKPETAKVVGTDLVGSISTAKEANVIIRPVMAGALHKKIRYQHVQESDTHATSQRHGQDKQGHPFKHVPLPTLLPIHPN